MHPELSKWDLLKRAFKDPKTSFFMLQDNGIKYYHSIRIPQATENRGLKTLVQKGIFTQEFLIQQELNEQYDVK